ncbi:MAG: pseudouridine synthase [Myxococcota bacterium]
MDTTLPRRLDKFLADARTASRSRLEAMWRNGRITVNGQPDYPLFHLIDPQEDEIRLDGARLQLRPPSIYALLHKPRGLLTAMRDPHPRQLIASLLPETWLATVGPVGRLDRDTTGALLLTDDGDLSHLLTHPDHHVWKRYVLTVRGDVKADDARLKAMRDGIVLRGEQTLPARCGVVPDSLRHDVRYGPSTELWVEIREGRNRQVRKMASKTGFRLRHLHRSHVGPIALGELKEGRWRLLSDSEVELLYQDAGGRMLPAMRARAVLERKLAQGQLEPRSEAIVVRYLKAYPEGVMA